MDWLTTDWWDAERVLAVSTAALAVGTIALALVAVFQDQLRSRLSHPTLWLSIAPSPPDCLSIPFSNSQTGAFICDSVYLRMRIGNSGRSSALQVEVFAQELRRQDASGSWRTVDSFLPMNLVWSNVGGMYFPSIAPEMFKHCDLGHIVDPSARAAMPSELNPALSLANDATSLAFDLIVRPNHGGHVIGPGKYRLDVLVAAMNAIQLRKTIEISISGEWYDDELKMLDQGIGVSIA